MRPRIRTVKPEIHADEDLWDLEQATGLPLFRAFVGLWNYADREGRFEWRPRALKAAILPYWEGDFLEVLAALENGRFIVGYAVDGRSYGLVRTFVEHQVINGKEPPSTLPDPPDQHTTATRDSRVTSASPGSEATSQGEGNGKGTELEREGNGSIALATVAPANDSRPKPVPLRRATSSQSPDRTYSVPKTEPPKDYLDEAAIRGIPLEQARSTWEWYQGAGLPERGVERLHNWLLHQAKEHLTKTASASPPVRASPRRTSGSKQPNAGRTGLESWKETV